MLALKVTMIGTSAGVILTKEALAHLNAKKGDTLYLTESADGGYRLAPYDPDFARQMQLAEDIMHDDRDILHAIHDRQLAEHGGLDGQRHCAMLGTAIRLKAQPR